MTVFISLKIVTTFIGISLLYISVWCTSIHAVAMHKGSELHHCIIKIIKVCTVKDTTHGQFLFSMWKQHNDGLKTFRGILCVHHEKYNLYRAITCSSSILSSIKCVYFLRLWQCTDTAESEVNWLTRHALSPLTQWQKIDFCVLFMLCYCFGKN